VGVAVAQELVIADLVPRQLEENRSLEWRVEERWRGERVVDLDPEH
jgi:hypothetical protein